MVISERINGVGDHDQLLGQLTKAAICTVLWCSPTSWALCEGHREAVSWNEENT